MEHEETRTEKAKASLTEDQRKLAELDREIREAEKSQHQRALSGETGLGMVEEETKTEQPDKNAGSV